MLGVPEYGEWILFYVTLVLVYFLSLCIWILNEPLSLNNDCFCTSHDQWKARGFL